MDELESRLEHELSGLARVPLAEPVPVDELRRRARRVRAGRALTSFAAVATAAVVIGALVVVIGNDSHTDHARKVQVTAPSFVLGDIDAVVLSSTFDEDGARNPFPANVAAAVARVAGVQRVSGVVDTFAPLVQGNYIGVDPGTTTRTPPRTPILFSYHQDDEVRLVTGRLPQAPDEIVVDADFVTRNHSAVDETVSFQVNRIQGQNLEFHVVGTFDLPGVDLSGIPLAAMSAEHQPPQLLLDRLDVKLGPGADAANVRDAIAIAVGDQFTVVQPSVISFPDQRLAQIEIQHAYWALLSPDPIERATAVEGPPTAEGNAEYEKHKAEAAQAELRVENVTFLSPDAALLTYRVYYGGGPSPIINAPQTGNATRVRGVWRIGSSTLCQLASYVNSPCAETGKVSVTPPNGWQPVSTLDPEVTRAFTALADPNATIDQRVAAIEAGSTLRSTIDPGVKGDSLYRDKAHFSILGWRERDATSVDVLYVLVTDDGPSTPWPMIAPAGKASDGHWYASQYYACGITGLVGGGCYASSGTPATAPVATTSP